MGIFTFTNLFYNFANITMYLLPFIVLYQGRTEESIREQIVNNDANKQIILIVFVICTSIVHLIIICVKLEREIIQKEMEKETLKKMKDDKAT